MTVTTTIAAVSVLVACGACGGGQVAPPAAPTQSVDQRKAESDAKGLVSEIYKTLGRTNTDGLMTLVTEPLVVFGPRRTDAMATRTDALVALKEFADTKKLAVRSNALVVGASPGGHSAWAVGLIAVQGAPMAMTAVLSNADDLWLVTAVALAATPSTATMRASVKKDAVVPPGMTAIAKIDSAASGAVDRFTAGLAEPKLWGDDLAAQDGTVAIGPAGDLVRGKAQLVNAWKKRAKTHVRAAIAGETSAGATPDGKLAWVSAPVVRFADGEDPLPLRVFAVFEPAADGWKLVALQESVAVDAAGSGATFKTIAAPAIAKPPEPVKKPKPTKPTKPTKKK